ncbi:MAG TPA: hypothetical protein VNF50_10770 [Acidimicrobiales bacterium]|nr:hypothetical protein [Acidimicrobiales bacterium]
MPELHIAQHEEADQLVSEDPLALLVAMVLDSTIPSNSACRASTSAAAVSRSSRRRAVPDS